ncbi:MAG: hypothetical protein ACREHC_04690 [Candidatus Levyibacteriota bacterium]
MKGRDPWNKGGNAKDDPRIDANTKAAGRTLKERHAKGELTTWITGRTAKTEPILQKLAREASERTKIQFIKTGKEKWLADRPGFIRTGRKNNERQKQAARTAILRSLYYGKIHHKKSKQELAIGALLKKANILVQDVMVDGVAYPDFYLPEYNVMLCVDGKYYHSIPQVAERDKREDKQLHEMDYIVIRLSEETAKELINDEAKLKQYIEKAVVDAIK